MHAMYCTINLFNLLYGNIVSKSGRSALTTKIVAIFLAVLFTRIFCVVYSK